MGSYTTKPDINQINKPLKCNINKQKKTSQLWYITLIDPYENKFKLSIFEGRLKIDEVIFCLFIACCCSCLLQTLLLAIELGTAIIWHPNVTVKE